MYILANHGIVYAWPYHSFCRILLAFAGQYCGSAPGGGFRHSEVNSVSNIHHKLKTQLLYRFPLHHGCHLLAHSLGNGSELLTNWHPSCD